MTLIELKKSIHQKIDGLNDRELLEIIDTLLTNRIKTLENSILTGYDQSRKGLTRPHTNVMQEFRDKNK
jgi:hypothetical protein